MKNPLSAMPLWGAIEERDSIKGGQTGEYLAALIDYPKFDNCHLLRRPIALNLEDFLGIFSFTVQVSTASGKNPQKILNLQRTRSPRYGGNCRI